MSNLLNALGMEFSTAQTETASDRDAFRAGWNAAVKCMAVMSEYPDHTDYLPRIEMVIFNDPATIIYWDDGAKTVVKCQPGDTFSAETGLMAAMLKRFMGNDNTYNKVINSWLGNLSHRPNSNMGGAKNERNL